MDDWKVNMLNMIGRVILAKSILNSIPTQLMQYIKLPQKIVEVNNKIQRDFVWGSNSNRKKLHLVSWDKLTKPKSYGGLGLHKAEHRNKAMHANLAWRLFKNTSSLWGRVLISK